MIRPINSKECGWAVVLGLIGVLVVAITALMALSVLFDSECCCCVPRLESDR
jgi:hypothetical protein